MNDWLLIGITALVLWVLWLFMRFVIELFREAARLREVSSTNKEKGSSVSSGSYSSQQDSQD